MADSTEYTDLPAVVAHLEERVAAIEAAARLDALEHCDSDLDRLGRAALGDKPSSEPPDKGVPSKT